MSDFKCFRLYQKECIIQTREKREGKREGQTRATEKIHIQTDCTQKNASYKLERREREREKDRQERQRRYTYKPIVPKRMHHTN